MPDVAGPLQLVSEGIDGGGDGGLDPGIGTGTHGFGEGEEFVGIWYGLSEAQLLVILEAIRSGIEALGLSHAYSDAAGVVTVSLGLAYLTPQSHQGLGEALRLADVALYLAKEQGRNRVMAKRQEGEAK